MNQQRERYERDLALLRSRTSNNNVQRTTAAVSDVRANFVSLLTSPLCTLICTFVCCKEYVYKAIVLTCGLTVAVSMSRAVRE